MNETASTVLNGMRNAYMAVAHDELVHDLIRMLMSKVSNSIPHVNYIRGHTRTLGPALLELQKNVKDLKNATVRDIFSPRYFTAIVSVFKIIVGHSIDAYAPLAGVNTGQELNFCVGI